MATTKSLYWATLGVLALSFMSSHSLGIQNRVQQIADQVCLRTAPLRALAQLSWGRTHFDIERGRAIEARVAAEQARLEAQQRRLQALSEVQMNQVMSATKVWKADRALRVERALRNSGIPATIECPESQVHFEMPDITEPMSNISQDPI
jgi:LPS O-antigen subunit length determinant protein (WzzB/FepE family)